MTRSLTNTHYRPKRPPRRRAKVVREWIGGRPPFGHVIDENNKLVVSPEGQAAIRKMHQLKAKGMSLRAIAAAMAETGVQISHMGVKKALAANP